MLKAFVFQLLESTVLSSRWFQIPNLRLYDEAFRYQCNDKYDLKEALQSVADVDGTVSAYDLEHVTRKNFHFNDCMRDRFASGTNGDQRPIDDNTWQEHRRQFVGMFEHPARWGWRCKLDPGGLKARPPGLESSTPGA